MKAYALGSRVYGPRVVVYGLGYLIYVFKSFIWVARSHCMLDEVWGLGINSRFDLPL